MAGVAPFGEREVHEIREVMRDFLDGGGPSTDTMEFHRKWGYLARLFFMSVDKERGSLLHLPYLVGVMEQPARTAAVFELMQNLFVEHLNKLAEANAPHR